jgi:hypothetical protein
MKMKKKLREKKEIQTGGGGENEDDRLSLY